MTTGALTAWRDLTAALERIGTELEAAAAGDEFDLGDGLLVLAKSLWQGVELTLESGDPLRPRFGRVDHGTRKLGGGCPDTDYDTASIDPQRMYRITGRRGTNCYLGVCVYGSDGVGPTHVVSNLSDRDLTFGPDGEFEIVLATEPPAGSVAAWLPLRPEAHTVVIRQYFHDRSTEAPATFDIELVGDPSPLRRRTDDEVATILRRVTRLTEFNATIGYRFLTDLRERPNELVAADTGRLMPFGPTPDNWYACGWYRLADDEALVIEGKAPEADYWGFHLHDRWMDNVDYPLRRTGINNSRIPVTGDGRYRVVIANGDESGPVSLDRGGRSEGHLFFRAQRAERVTLPTCTVTPLRDL